MILMGFDSHSIVLLPSSDTNFFFKNLKGVVLASRNYLWSFLLLVQESGIFVWRSKVPEHQKVTVGAPCLGPSLWFPGIILYCEG